MFLINLPLSVSCNSNRYKLAPERQSGVSNLFSTIYTALAVNEMGLSFTYLDARCAFRSKLITLTYIILPVRRSQRSDAV